jgi:hypothetical protein
MWANRDQDHRIIPYMVSINLHWWEEIALPRISLFSHFITYDLFIPSSLRISTLILLLCKSLSHHQPYHHHPLTKQISNLYWRRKEQDEEGVLLKKLEGTWSKSFLDYLRWIGANLILLSLFNRLRHTFFKVGVNPIMLFVY